jgi:hypothetical protein
VCNSALCLKQRAVHTKSASYFRLCLSWEKDKSWAQHLYQHELVSGVLNWINYCVRPGLTKRCICSSCSELIVKADQWLILVYSWLWLCMMYQQVYSIAGCVWLFNSWIHFISEEWFWSAGSFWDVKHFDCGSAVILWDTLVNPQNTLLSCRG